MGAGLLLAALLRLRPLDQAGSRDEGPRGHAHTGGHGRDEVGLLLKCFVCRRCSARRNPSWHTSLSLYAQKADLKQVQDVVTSISIISSTSPSPDECGCRKKNKKNSKHPTLEPLLCLSPLGSCSSISSNRSLNVAHCNGHIYDVVFQVKLPQILFHV